MCPIDFCFHGTHLHNGDVLSALDILILLSNLPLIVTCYMLSSPEMFSDVHSDRGGIHTVKSLGFYSFLLLVLEFYSNVDSLFVIVNITTDVT